MRSRFLQRAAAVSLIAGGLAACDVIEAQSTQVNITFDGDCPTGTNATRIDAKRKDLIVWRAVDGQGQTVSVPFEIHFDPLRNEPLRAPAGRLGKKIDFRAPPGDYKYSVVGLRCDGDSLDPMIRVLR